MNRKKVIRMSEARKVHLYPNPKQLRFLESTTRHTAYGGARGGGKSWVIRVKAVMDAATYGAPDKWSEGIKICIVRRTLEDLRKNTLPSFNQISSAGAAL